MAPDTLPMSAESLRVIDGAGEEYEVEWATIEFHLRHVETGARVTADHHTIAKLGQDRAAIIAALDRRSRV